MVGIESDLSKSGIKKWIRNLFLPWIVFVLIVFFPLFYQLGQTPLKIWDESRMALSAYEMNKSGNWLIPTIDGAPDMWNTKPPLLIWMQVVSMKILGANECSIRFPSAIAALLCCVFIVLLFKRFTSLWWGIFAVIVLLTSEGYVAYHAARSGDYDSMLAFFCFSAFLSLFIFSEYGNPKYRNYFFVGILLALFTKAAAALMFIPGILLYLACTKKLSLFLGNKKLWLGTGFVCLLFASYYLIREFYNPGYIQASLQNDYSGRFLHAIENHRESFWYFISNMIAGKFKSWIWFLPISVITSFFDQNNFRKRLTHYCILIACSYLLIISLSMTKLEWYDVPLYPFLAIPVAGLFSFLADTMKRKKRSLAIHLTLILSCCLLAVAHYKRVLNKINYRESRVVYYYYDIENYLRTKASVIDRNPVEEKIVSEQYPVHLKFYAQQIRDHQGKISFIRKEEIREKDRIITCEPEVMQYIDRNFRTQKILDNYRLKIYSIVNRIN